MARMRLKISGFDKMLERIQQAGGDVDKAARDCMEESLQVLESNLKKEAQANGVETTTVFHSVTTSGNRVKGEAGWPLGNYDSNNPSEGYAAMFAEFGTGKHSQRSKGKDRQTAAGHNRGSTEPHPFMEQARAQSVKPIKAIQRKTLKNIVKELEG